MCKQFRETVSVALLLFLEQGIEESGKSLPEQFINCGFNELQKFMEDLGRKKDQLPDNLLHHCLVDPIIEGE